MKVKVKFVGLDTKQFSDKKKVIIKKIARKGIQIFSQEIKKRHLINTGNLLHSVGATIRKSGVDFDIDADYAGIINDGVKKHKMTYLLDAKLPIPVTTKRGKLNFRIATEKSMRKGGWTHPGFTRGKGFFDVSANKISDISKEIILDESVV